MRNFKFLQPVDLMERITRSELCAQFDEILEKVDQENVGVVITDADKDDLVLCPASWFMCIYDDDFGCIVNSALRYALGRYTYMPSVVMGFVRKYLDVLDTRTVSVMIEDIDREADNEDLSYRDEWLLFRDELQEHLTAMLHEKGHDNKEQPQV